MKLPDLVQDVSRQVLRVGVALAARLLRQRAAQPVREALHHRRVVGEQPERLDVEHEAGGGARHPELAVAGRRRRVVRRIHLHDVELVGVVAQSILGAGDPSRQSLLSPFPYP